MTCRFLYVGVDSYVESGFPDAGLGWRVWVSRCGSGLASLGPRVRVWADSCGPAGVDPPRGRHVVMLSVGSSGAEYGSSSLLLPAAAGLANLTRLATCVPELPLGGLLCAHARAQGALRRLVPATAACPRSQVCANVTSGWLPGALCVPSPL